LIFARADVLIVHVCRTVLLAIVRLVRSVRLCLLSLHDASLKPTQAIALPYVASV